MSDSETASEQTPTRPEATELPASELLALLTGPRELSDELNATTVPEPLMHLVIEHAMSWLEAHGRTCRRPATCRDTQDSCGCFSRSAAVTRWSEARERSTGSCGFTQTARW